MQAHSYRFRHRICHHACLIALAGVITYLTLFHQYLLELPWRNDMNPTSITIVAGFPLPFLQDGYVSPAGSLEINSLWIWLGLDEWLWQNFLLDWLFWWVAILGVIQLGSIIDR